MLELAFLFSYFLFPIFIFTVMHKAGFSILKIGLLQFVIIATLIFSYTGTLILFYGLDQYRVEIGVTDQWLIFKVNFYNGISLIMLLLGGVAAKTFLGTKSAVTKLEGVLVSLREGRILVLALFLVVIVLILYLFQVPEIALFAIPDGAKAVARARSVMGNDFPGKYHWYSLVMHDLANVITFASFALCLTLRRKVYFFFFLVSFSISSFSALMATEKAPFTWLLIGLFIVYTIVINKGRYDVLKFTSLVLFLMGALTIFYVFFMGSLDIYSGIHSTLSRILVGSSQPAYFYLEFIPKYQEFLYGLSLPNPSGLLDFEPYRLTVEIMNWLDPSATEQGVVGSMPAVFWAEAYANFGAKTLVIVSFLIGFYLFLLDYILSSLPNTPFKIGIYVWMLLHYQELSVTGFSNFLVDIRAFVLTLFLILTIVFCNTIVLGFNYGRSAKESP